MKAITILLLSLALAAPASAETGAEDERLVIDAAANYLVDHPFPYYRHHWKVLVASESRLRFTPLFIPDTSKAPHAESFGEAVADVTSRNASAIGIAKAPEGLGFAELARVESATGYDWEALRREHGEIDAVVELSRPGFDATGSYAIVVSHTATSNGNSAMVCELVRDEAGNWKAIGGTSSPGIRKVPGSKQ